MSDIKTKIIQKLGDSTGTPIEDISLPRFSWDNPKYEPLMQPTNSVMASYQNANRWLDTIKEYILLDLKLPYFSSIVHGLAHRMPAYFDRFGDILHTENLSVPYPTTLEWSQSLGDLKNIIHNIYQILDSIKESLVRFQSIAKDISPNFSLQCDQLILDISTEYQIFIYAEGRLDYYSDSLLPLWEKDIFEYSNVRRELI